MGALRKAGVWLGLVEEEDDRSYDGRYDDDFDEDDDDFEPQARPRSLSRAHNTRVASVERPSERSPLPDRTPLGDRQGHTERSVLTERTGEHPRVLSDRSGVGDRSGLSERSGFSDRSGLSERGALSERTGEHPRVLSDRSSVRPIARPSTSSAGYPATTSYPTQDSLALVPPQVQLRDRTVVPDDPERRYQITTLHPTTYTEARTIGEHFRDGVPVIINLTEMDEADARRLVDFAAGLAFGLRGNIERVTNRVFLLSPANVQVTAEDKAKIAEGGFFDQS